MTELANTLTALTLAGVPVQDTYMKYVVISLRRIVTVTNSPAEAATDFSMVPRNPARPRVYEVPTEPNESPTFNVLMQDSVLAGQAPGKAVETLLLTRQSGTVSLVLAFIEADIDEVPPDEIDYNAPTLVTRERVAEFPDLTMVDTSNSVTLRVPARQLRKMAYVSF